MWNPSKPYYLPNILLNGLKSPNVTIDAVGNLHIADLSLPDLLDKAPWGTVGVDLSNNTLAGVNTMAPSPDAPTSFTYDDTSGAFTAKIKFSQITLSGNYDAKTGGLLGCAVDVAAIGSKIIDPINKSALRATAAAGASEVAPLDSARNYRSQLLQTDNGTVMVQTYYENNDTYAELFSDPLYKSFQQVWAQHTTNGQTTQYYGLQTNSAVQPANAGTVPVNGQPDANGNSPYNAHSFFMQNFLMHYCYAAASHFGTATEKGKRYTKAGNDAGTFGANVQPSSAKSMTANSVMSTVATTSPPSEDSRVRGAGTFLRASSPQWLRSVHNRAQEMAADAAQKDLTRPAEVRLGDTGIPITGSYSDSLATSVLTLKGTITFSGANASVVFSSITGDLGDISITLSKPTGVNSDLFTAIAQAIANTSWVKSMLASGIKSQLSSASLLDKLNSVMNAALSKALG
jgi:hypothetical protein